MKRSSLPSHSPGLPPAKLWWLRGRRSAPAHLHAAAPGCGRGRRAPESPHGVQCTVLEHRQRSGEAPDAAETSRSWARTSECGYPGDPHRLSDTQLSKSWHGQPRETGRGVPWVPWKPKRTPGCPRAWNEASRGSQANPSSSRSYVEENSEDESSGDQQLLNPLKDDFFSP